MIEVSALSVGLEVYHPKINQKGTVLARRGTRDPWTKRNGTRVVVNYQGSVVEWSLSSIGLPPATQAATTEAPAKPEAFPPEHPGLLYGFDTSMPEGNR
jgi:hypothetical protein